jgi:hypothetical protein
MSDPHEDLRRQVTGDQDRRLARIGRVLDSAKLGELSPGQALGFIEEIASGEDARVVRVGTPGRIVTPWNPKIQTGRG